MDAIIFICFAYFIHITHGRICGEKCCYGYVMIKGSCQKCPLGTFGENCDRKCGVNTYGEDCKGVCNCKIGYFCNSAIGCTKIPDDDEIKNPTVVLVRESVLNQGSSTRYRLKQYTGANKILEDIIASSEPLDKQQQTTEGNTNSESEISIFLKDNATSLVLGVAGLIILGLLISILVTLQRGRRITPPAVLPIQQLPMNTENVGENPTSSNRVYAEINENLLSEFDNEAEMHQRVVGEAMSEVEHNHSAHAYNQLQNITEKDELRAQYTDLGSSPGVQVSRQLYIASSVREKYEQISRIERETDDYTPMPREENSL